MEVGLRFNLGLGVLPTRTLAVLQSPNRGHDEIVLSNDVISLKSGWLGRNHSLVVAPSPDCQLAQVRTRVVNDGLVHVVPKGQAPGPVGPLDVG